MMHRMSPPPDGYLPLPTRVAPMMATLADALPADDERWAYEMKWDGVRAVVNVEGGTLACIEAGLPAPTLPPP